MKLPVSPIHDWMIPGAKALFWEYEHHKVIPVTIAEPPENWGHNTLVVVEAEKGHHLRVSVNDIRRAQREHAPSKSLNAAELLQHLAALIHPELPDTKGFALLVFDLGPGGTMNYVSNAQRADMVPALVELLAHLMQASEPGATIQALEALTEQLKRKQS